MPSNKLCYPIPPHAIDVVRWSGKTGLDVGEAQIPDLMSRRARRNFTASFKAEVVLEALKERRTISEPALQFDLYPNQITS